MNRKQRRFMVAGLVMALATFSTSCSSVVENDFDEVLGFNGFFSDSTCGEGLAALVLALAPGDPTETTSEGVCFLGAPCIVALQLENFTTGVPIPSNGSEGSEGSPVPSNDGVRIQTKRIRVEFALPFGEIATKEFAYNSNIDPGDTQCAEFLFLLPDDSIAMVQNPLDFPEPPYNFTTRVTVEGVTEGGLSIRTQADLNVFVTDVDATIDQ